MSNRSNVAQARFRLICTAVVRKVSPDGIITTIAGNGLSNYFADGGPAIEASLSALGVAVDSAGNVYVADSINGRLREISTTGVISTVAGNGNFQSLKPKDSWRVKRRSARPDSSTAFR